MGPIGSRQGGLALMAIATARPQPIPAYAGKDPCAADCVQFGPLIGQVLFAVPTLA